MQASRTEDGRRVPSGVPGAPYLRSLKDFAAGLCLLAFALFGWSGASGLPMTKAGGVGLGLLPKIMSGLLGVLGVVLTVQALFRRGAKLERGLGSVNSADLATLHFRGLIFVYGSALLFAATINGFELFGLPVQALGLMVAGPLAVIVSGLAHVQTRWTWIAVYAFAVAAIAALILKSLLRSQMPVAPWLLGY